MKTNPKTTKREHIKSIKKLKKDIENNICPRCGKELVIRVGSYGRFYRCSGYPECIFKKKMNN